ncbi:MULTISPECIES: SRPBCC family protein [unclassified Tenacibaculum]|uniref:SRPBCC family protein n=1 Tax=unclassified Tenacibaculum TaxID=2635139 RepID=UPI001F4749CC|nr:MULTISPECIES: GyrI-like domain-containing protein [unclassified Tenacibaculum]MCF2876562.1 GyrI-like domain-containing protein [Tenacibaculum sp. Cn5-1]MCF2936531.1 GyrI-like domain-containing protein [Tenacibaculum sp. Cn5-34]MCG7511876.1 GyrI-like domain-containing protein [Tenacibaculum sp. Cn5-46]
MKILKYILLLIVAVIAIGLIYVSTYSGSYDVSRSKVIKAPIAHAFNTVNDLKTWEKWGPWHDEDSTIVVTYGEKTVGVGASDSWTSKDGPGKMETVALVENKSIDQKISFMDNEPGDIYWNFEEVAEGTKVTWGMKAEKSPFVFKMFAALTGGWDNMLGPMEEKGLDNLEKVLLETIPATPKFTIGEISTKEVSEKIFIGFPHKIKINHEEMTRLFMQDLPKAGIHAAKSGLKLGDYTPGAVFSKYDEKSGETEFYIGLLLNKDLAPATGMKVVKLPAGNSLVISKFGNYGEGDYDAHTKIGNYLKENNLTQKWPIWELYVNDPSTVKPTEIQTDIYYPIE